MGTNPTLSLHVYIAKKENEKNCIFIQLQYRMKLIFEY